jgi:hypothetical protein
MPNIYPNQQTAEVDSNILTVHVPVSEAFKLVTRLKFDRRQALAFNAYVHTTFEVTNPRDAERGEDV